MYNKAPNITTTQKDGQVSVSVTVPNTVLPPTSLGTAQLTTITDNIAKIATNRDMYKTDTVNNVMAKAMAVATIANAGLEFVKSASKLIDYVSGSSLAKSLTMLGPIGLGISVGLELFSLALKLYNGELFTPKPTEFEQTINAIKAVGTQVDNMAKRLDFLFA